MLLHRYYNLAYSNCSDRSTGANHGVLIPSRHYWRVSLHILNHLLRCIAELIPFYNIGYTYTTSEHLIAAFSSE